MKRHRLVRLDHLRLATDTVRDLIMDGVTDKDELRAEAHRRLRMQNYKFSWLMILGYLIPLLLRLLVAEDKEVEESDG